MLATQCSKPVDTNMATGSMVSIALVNGLEVQKVSQIAKQTNRLHRTPSATACTGVW